MLGHGGSGSGGDEGGGGGDVEGAAAVSTGAAGIDQDGLLGGREREVRGGGAHDVYEAGDLGGGFATGGEGSEESGDLDVGELAGEDGLHEGAGLLTGEGAAAFYEVLEMGLEGHRF